MAAIDFRNVFNTINPLSSSLRSVMSLMTEPKKSIACQRALSYAGFSEKS